MRYLVGLIGFPLGLVVVIYRERIKRFTGNFDWAEKYLGAGGTYSAIMLLGLLLSIGCLMYALGTLQALTSAIFGPLLGGSVN